MAEPVTEASAAGSVVLDIGGDIGAAVVFAPANWVGVEVEIAAGGRPWDGTHTAIRPRNLSSGVVYAGVFEALKEGPYRVRPRVSSGSDGPSGATDMSDPPFLEIEVRGGGVTYADLRSQLRGGAPPKGGHEPGERRVAGAARQVLENASCYP
jgi:hypothetical protein